MDHELRFSIGSDFNMHFYASLTGGVSPPYEYPHHIENEIELFVLVEGDVSFAVESRVYRLSPGDIILTKPNEMHHCIRNSTTVNHHYCFYFEPSCDFIFGDFMKHNFGCDNLISPIGADRELVLSLAERINLLSQSEGENRLELLALSLELLSTVRRNIGKSSKTERLPESLELVLAEMDERLSEISSLEALSAKLFVSRSTLTRLFKRYLGTTPRTYLESKRLAVARRMLGEGVSVSDTCRAIGFVDTSSFIRLFKKRFGETPYKYSQK